MNQEELKKVLYLHRKWVLGEPDGERADLNYAYLRSADLRYADLRSANLRSANLRSANLRYADLRYADLRYADLNYANLSDVKDDFFKVLSTAKTEVLFLYDSLMRGKINGSQYQGECACLIGTIANARHEKYDHLGIDLKPDFDRPSERWFLGISTGDIPQSNPISEVTAGWVREFMDAEKIGYPKYEIVAVEGDEFK